MSPLSIWHLADPRQGQEGDKVEGAISNNPSCETGLHRETCVVGFKKILAILYSEPLKAK